MVYPRPSVPSVVATEFWVRLLPSRSNAPTFFTLAHRLAEAFSIAA